MKPVQHGSIEYQFERRRYGSGPSTRFFTWLMWRQVNTREWQTFGDPWPKVRLNKAELAVVLKSITDYVALQCTGTEKNPDN